MASVLYRKRGDSNLWTYEIRNEGKTVAHNSGFKTKKLAESEAEPILQELRLGKRISRDISLADLYQEWLRTSPGATPRPTRPRTGPSRSRTRRR